MKVDHIPSWLDCLTGRGGLCGRGGCGRDGCGCDCRNDTLEDNCDPETVERVVAAVLLAVDEEVLGGDRDPLRGLLCFVWDEATPAKTTLLWNCGSVSLLVGPLSDPRRLCERVCLGLSESSLLRFCLATVCLTASSTVATA